jgi:hypothetical protein
MRGWYIHGSTCKSEWISFQVPLKPKKSGEGKGRTGVKSEGTIDPRSTGTSIGKL